MADTSYLDKLKAHRLQTAQTNKEQSEFRAMITEMRKTQAATLAGQGKPPIILTDQTDLGDKVKELTAKTTAAIQALATPEHNKQQLEILRELVRCLESVETAVDRYEAIVDRQTTQLVAAIQKIELSPNITVPTPQVTLHEKDVNLKPLEKAINGLKTTKATNLSDYRAHDLDDSPDGSQYVGFIAMDGSWYIMHSDDKTNTIRYYFGNENYDEAWNYRGGHTYTTLSEAIHGLAA